MLLTNNFFNLQQEQALGGLIQSGKTEKTRGKGIFSISEI